MTAQPSFWRAMEEKGEEITRKLLSRFKGLVYDKCLGMEEKTFFNKLSYRLYECLEQPLLEHVNSNYEKDIRNPDDTVCFGDGKELVINHRFDFSEILDEMIKKKAEIIEKSDLWGYDRARINADLIQALACYLGSVVLLLAPDAPSYFAGVVGKAEDGTYTMLWGIS
jgi:hypothetical protein